MKRSITTIGIAATMAIAAGLGAACHEQGSRRANTVGDATVTSAGVDQDATHVRVATPDGRTVNSITRGADATDLGDEDDGEQLARAMCERELVCGHVAPGGRYGTLKGCLVEARSHATARLADAACLPDRTMLATCLANVRAERCDDDLDVTTRIHACRAVELCAH